MNPINVICETCGIDILIEPEVAEDEAATCPTCKGNLFETEQTCPKKKQLYDLETGNDLAPIPEKFARHPKWIELYNTEEGSFFFDETWANAYGAFYSPLEALANFKAYYLANCDWQAIGYH